MRSLDIVCPVAADPVLAQIIDHNDEDVGLLGRGFLGKSRGDEKDGRRDGHKGSEVHFHGFQGN